MFVGRLGTFVALGVRGSGMIENRSFNLVEFYVKMGKTNRNLFKEDMDETVFMFALFKCRKFDKRRN